jgi:hypothetical protein
MFLQRKRYLILDFALSDSVINVQKLQKLSSCNTSACITGGGKARIALAHDGRTRHQRSKQALTTIGTAIINENDFRIFSNRTTQAPG